MAIYEITSDKLREIPKTTFGATKVRERDDLQRLLRDQIEIIDDDILIIAEEFKDWEDSSRRIDLLGLDTDANLVVIELKRTEDGGHMELQALRYAAMVSKMTFEKAVQVYAAYLSRRKSAVDARASILKHLEWDEQTQEDFASEVRIILVSAEFSKELTTTVMWLNDCDLDIRCVRLRPYSDGGRVLVDVQRIIPLPEAEDYLVKLKEKQESERSERRGQTEWRQLFQRFWTQLLAKAAPRIKLHENISPSSTWYVRAASGLPGVSFVYVFGRTTPRVELYVSKGDAAANKQVFDALMRAKKEIEQRFGNTLGWERLDDKKTCRVRFDFEAGTVRDEANWPDIQEKMIANMVRFESALRPELDKLK